MDFRRFLVGLGPGITTFLLVAVVVIEAVAVDPGAGILGVLAGAIIGGAILGAVAYKFEDADAALQSGIQAVAAFGYTALVLFFLESVDGSSTPTWLDSVPSSTPFPSPSRRPSRRS